MEIESDAAFFIRTTVAVVVAFAAAVLALIVGG